jgi:hypothetical protein
LEYFTDIWYILWPFGIFCVYLVHFPRFGIKYWEKSGNPGAPSQVNTLNLLCNSRLMSARGKLTESSLTYVC